MDTRSGTVGANHAAEQMAGAIRDSYQAITSSAIKLQERNLRLSQNLFEVWSETLMEQAEANRTMAQGLAEQTRSQQTVVAYLGIVDSMFSFYWGALKGLKEALELAAAVRTPLASQETVSWRWRTTIR